AHATMRTDVVESLEAVVVLTDDENGLGTEIAHQVVARLRRLVRHASYLPGSHPHPFPFALEVFRRNVAFSSDRCHSQRRLRHASRTAGAAIHSCSSLR